jgi:hypothetical protein
MQPAYAFVCEDVTALQWNMPLVHLKKSMVVDKIEALYVTRHVQSPAL